MTKVVRVTPEETYKKVESGKALLACAYDDDEKFRLMQLQGAVSFSELESKLESLPKNQEIIFYCA
ncbi:MAG: ArsR family transcriptional regulator [Proteobacteria bacterium]|nr:ArsR family transcriptional regulator [Pseudomonadota bacterium]